jgi:magnesium-transporting ATPase (P-type)
MSEPQRSRFITTGPTVADVEACRLPARTKRQFVPLIGDTYVRCRHPVSGVEKRCVLLEVSSVGGSFVKVRFYDGDTEVPGGEPVIVSVSALEPLIYPRLDPVEGKPVPKSMLLLTCSATGLSTSEAASRLAVFGPNTLEEEQMKDPLCELLQCFCGSMPCLIWGAFFVGVLRIAWADCVVLLMLQLVNGSFGWHEDTKASAAISALKASLQPHALCRRNGSDNDIQARDLVPGDIVLLSAGSVVPADCELLTGPVEVDRARISGDLLPVTMQPGQVALMGSAIISGDCEAVVFDHGPHTYCGKKATRMAKLADTTSEVAQFHAIMSQITNCLTALSLLLVCVVCGLLLYREQAGLDVLSFGVVLLVAAIPIALPVVWRSSLAIGARALAQQAGAILTSLPSMERLASMNMLFITVQAPLDDDTTETVRRARECGVHVKLISTQPDIKAFGTLRQRGWRFGLTGRGVKDAAALKAADLGIAVHGATDTARAASDLVLTSPSLSAIVDAIELSREIMQRLLAYAIYRIACTTLLLSFFFVISTVLATLASPTRFIGMSPGCQDVYNLVPLSHNISGTEYVQIEDSQWVTSAVAQMSRHLCHKQFALPVTAIVLVTILNDATILSIAYDTVVASQQPAAWRLREVCLVSTLLGLVSAAASIILLYCGLAANAAGSWFELFGLAELPDDTYDVLRYDWQQLAAHDAAECPAGGCDWAMCNPPVWSDMTTMQQLGWQQPTFCFRYGQLQAMIFLHLCLSSYMTVWSARTHRSVFCSERPGRPLLIAPVSGMFAASLLSWSWPFAELEPLDPSHIGKTWIYSICWFVLQDSAKLALYKAFGRCRSGAAEILADVGVDDDDTVGSLLPPRLSLRSVNKTCPALPYADSSSWSPKPLGGRDLGGGAVERSMTKEQQQK